MSAQVTPWLLSEDFEQSSRLTRKPLKVATTPEPKRLWHHIHWQYARDLFSESSLHGISHIAQAGSWYRRVIWIVLFVMCMSGFMYQAGSYFYLYFSYPTTVEVKVENVGSLEFPGVTICNSNRVRKDVLCSEYPKACINSVSDNEDVMSHLDKQIQIALGHNKSGLFVQCTLQGRESILGEECIRHFQLYYIADHGNCYTFNARWNSRDDKLFYAYESDIWNLPTILEMQLNVEADQYLDQSVVPALLVSVHSPDSYPDPEAARIKTLPGNLYNIGLKKSTTILLPLPYQTNCTEYRHLPWTRNYTGIIHPKMCTQECSRDAQKRSCRCVSSNLTRLSEDNPCESGLGAACAEEVEQLSKEYCRTLCRVPCERTMYEITVDTTSWPKNVKKNEFGSWANKSMDDIKKNLVRVKIYLRTMEHTKYEHHPKYLLVEVFSHLGGYLSLWLGFSVLTVWEIFDNTGLVLKRAWVSWKYANKRRRLALQLQRTLTEDK